MSNLSSDAKISRKQALLDIECLTLVLAYVSRVIRLGGFWSEQGNTTKDQRAWYVRVLLGVADLNTESLADQLKLSQETIRAMQNDCKVQVEDLRNDAVACEL